MEKTQVGTFHGTEYEITVSEHQDNLTIVLVETESLKKWSQTFSAADIETLTEKAKNAKRFNIFCKMLFGSLENTSQSTMIDILTPYDINLFKSNKMAQRRNGNHSFSQEKAPKIDNDRLRHFILIYIMEYDKVAYPMLLPQVKEQTANKNEKLKREVQRLRNHIRSMNQQQQQQSQKNLFPPQGTPSQSHIQFNPKSSAHIQQESQNEKILQQLLIEKDKEISDMKKLHVQELQVFTNRIDDLELQIESKDLKIDDLESQLTAAATTVQQVTPLQTDAENFDATEIENDNDEFENYEPDFSDEEYRDLGSIQERGIQKTRGTKAFRNNLRMDSQKTVTDLKRALNKSKTAENKLKQRIKELQKEMETLRKQIIKPKTIKKFCSRCGTTVLLTDKVKRAGTGYRSPMKYRSGGSKAGSRNGSRLGSRKNSVTGSRKASSKGSLNGSRTSTPHRKKKSSSKVVDYRRKIIGGRSRPRGSVTSNYSRNSNASRGSKRSMKSNTSMRSTGSRRSRKSKSKNQHSSTIGYRKRNLPTLEERRRSRERLGISSYGMGRRNSIDSKGSRRSRKSSHKRSKSRKKVARSRGSSRNSSLNGSFREDSIERRRRKIFSKKKKLTHTDPNKISQKPYYKKGSARNQLQMEGQANSFLPKMGQNFTDFIAPTGNHTELRNRERIFRSQMEKKEPRAIDKYTESDMEMKTMEEKYQRLKKMIQKNDSDEEWRMSEF